MTVVEKDKINTSYRQLFTVRLLHSGYGAALKTSIKEVVKVEPDDATRKLMLNYNMGYRFVNDTLICFIRTSLFAQPAPLPVVPFVKFSGVKKFRFLVFASPDFLASTDVEPAGAATVYQFTNQANAGTAGVISVHTAGVNADDLKDVTTVKPAKNCFAVIDIISQGASGAAYELFDGVVNQQLKSPAYAIPFKSKI